MAKNIARGTTANDWVLPKLVFAVALVGFIALVMTSPAEAATLVKTGGAGLSSATESLATFINDLS
ncbi:hypothetical protein [Salinifilum ghardaiensis]